MQRKTKRYYEVDSLGRKHHSGVVYFGEHKDTRNAWYPHGPGKLLTDCRSLLSSSMKYMHVDARFLATRGTCVLVTWEGEGLGRGGLKQECCGCGGCAVAEVVYDGTFSQGMIHGKGTVRWTFEYSNTYWICVDTIYDIML